MVWWPRFRPRAHGLDQLDVLPVTQCCVERHMAAPCLITLGFRGAEVSRRIKLDLENGPAVHEGDRLVGTNTAASGKLFQ